MKTFLIIGGAWMLAALAFSVALALAASKHMPSPPHRNETLPHRNGTG